MAQRLKQTRVRRAAREAAGLVQYCSVCDAPVSRFMPDVPVRYCSCQGCQAVHRERLSAP